MKMRSDVISGLIFSDFISFSVFAVIAIHTGRDKLNQAFCCNLLIVVDVGDKSEEIEISSTKWFDGIQKGF
jgi:hypothetical protein